MKKLSKVTKEDATYTSKGDRHGKNKYKTTTQ